MTNEQSPRAALVHAVVGTDKTSAESTNAAVLGAVHSVFPSDEEFPRGPFGRFLQSDDKAFVLVNHVMHRRDGESSVDFASKITDPEVIGSVVDILTQALDSAGQITIGNAPLQGCDYERMRVESGMQDLLQRWNAKDRPELRDLRGLASTWTRLGAKVSEERRSPEDGIAIDLGTSSMLEPLYSRGHNPQFRVGDYSGEETSEYHAKGRHVYVINRHVLESKLIVSVPTLKTHQKVGITCALKGTVGAVFLKQCLAHHRLGGPDQGGDEFYPDGFLLRRVSALAERTGGLGTGPLANIERVISKVAYRAARFPRGQFVGGAWSGNDTAWRMTLDIARVLRFGRLDGTLADSPQREHVAVIDGIVAGEGEGPLRPTARNEGVVIAGRDPVAADVLAALAMGWNPKSLPLLSRSVRISAYPVADYQELCEIPMESDGFQFDLQNPPSLVSRPFIPPKGWDPQQLFVTTA